MRVNAGKMYGKTFRTCMKKMQIALNNDISQYLYQFIYWKNSEVFDNLGSSALSAKNKKNVDRSLK